MVPPLGNLSSAARARERARLVLVREEPPVAPPPVAGVVPMGPPLGSAEGPGLQVGPRAPVLEATLQAGGRQLLIGLVAIEVTLACLHAAITWTTPEADRGFAWSLVHLDREHNLPTWFSALQLSFAGLLAVVIAVFERARPFARAVWGLAAVGAFFLSADEACAIHEALGTGLGRIAESAEQGTALAAVVAFPSYYWGLIYGLVGIPAAIVLGVFFWRELAGMRRTMIAGMAIFIFGALVLDHVEGRWGAEGHAGLPFELLGAQRFFDVFLLEELAEMVGVTLAVAALYARAAASVVRAASESRPAVT